jgi:hypothetical protein
MTEGIEPAVADSFSVKLEVNFTISNGVSIRQDPKSNSANFP